MTTNPPVLHGLACPLDGSPLSAGGMTALRCEMGHSFDRAKEGYVNLLLVQHKASRDPGDSREMVAARRRFLNAGHYAPIADRLVQIAGTLASDPSAAPVTTVLDAGCGEGYYLDRLARTMPAQGRSFAGIDISKWAVRSAAKRNAGCFWAVASNRHLPFVAGSVDLVLSMFGFPLWDAFAGIQRAGGSVMLVDPGPDHLIELRQVIYGEVRRSSPPSLAPAEAAGYRLVDEQPLRFCVHLERAAAIADLMVMTPHDHRASQAGRERLARLDRLEVTADVVFRHLRKA